MSKPTILLDGTPTEVIEMLGDGFEIVPWTEQPNSDGLSRCVGVLAYSHPTCDGELMDLMPNLKVVSNYGVGVDHIDVTAAAERGIPVGNTPGCLDASTADMSMALILAVARNVVIGDKYAHSAAYTHHDPSILIGREVTGSTLGIIGMGRIGKQVARRAKGFDMRILYHNRNRDEQAEQELGVTYSKFDDLLRESDFISLNCPLTEETTGMIADREFGLMKSSAILVNLARGPVVNSDALCRALSSGSIAAAGLDVTDPEPLPRDHPLLEQENAIILPHFGSASDRTRTRMAEMSVENLLAGLDSRVLPYRVLPR